MSGTILIMIAASLWAIDAIFRTQLTFSIPAALIILIEHVIGLIALLPFLIRDWSAVKKLSSKSWINLIALAAISSVGGTIFFTQALAKSFAAKDFITPLLLLKLQPIFAITLAWLFLKEKITVRFLGIALMACIGSYLIGFGWSMPQLALSGKTLVFILAIAAPLCWGAGTILSKNLLHDVSFSTAAALRYLAAIPVAVIAAYALGQTYDVMHLGWNEVWRFLVIALVTGGTAAIYIYYKGLQKTEAKVSSIVELVFPLVSVIIGITSLNPYGEPQTLNTAQIVGIVLLIGAILLLNQISIQTDKKS